jgi:hypothetical protein
MNQLSVFEYLYCDASNFKVWGHAILRGQVTNSDVARLRECLEAGEFFIAEQLGLPPLYAELWTCSGGPTSADHIWHTFHALRVVQIDEASAQPYDTVENFIARFEAISEWNGALSPHWRL